MAGADAMREEMGALMRDGYDPTQAGFGYDGDLATADTYACTADRCGIRREMIDEIRAAGVEGLAMMGGARRTRRSRRQRRNQKRKTRRGRGGRRRHH
jgi:hypothetical protein